MVSGLGSSHVRRKDVMRRKFIVFVSEGDKFAPETPLLQCCKVLLGRRISIVDVAWLNREDGSIALTVTGDPLNIEIARCECDEFAKCGLAA